MRSHKEKGFSIIEVLVIIGVIALVAWIGYVLVSRQQSTNNQSPTADVQSAPTINSVADLDSAQKTLDSDDFNGGYASDLAQLNSEMASFQ